MAVIDKLNKYLPPLPRLRESNSRDSDSPDGKAVRKTGDLPELRALLLNYLRPNLLSEEEVQEARHQLDERARRNGYTFAAAEVQTFLDKLPHSSDGQSYEKPKVYALVAEWHFRHLKNELEEADRNNKPLGPNLFEGYVQDYVDNLLKSDVVSHGAQRLVLLVEVLWMQGVYSTDASEKHLSLAERGASTLAQAFENAIASASRERHMAMRLERRGETPLPMRRSQTPDARFEALSKYLAQLAAAAKAIRPAVEPLSVKAVLTQEAITAGQFDRATAERHVAFLAQVAKASHEVKWPAYHAALLRHAGILREQIARGAGLPSLLRAAALLREQANVEESLGLMRLTRRRLKGHEDLAGYVKHHAPNSQ